MTYWKRMRRVRHTERFNIFGTPLRHAVDDGDWVIFIDDDVTEILQSVIWDRSEWSEVTNEISSA